MLVGVLGGMGPSATVDFLDKLTRLTEAAVDQDHVRVIALSDPVIPDRSAAIAGLGPSPEPALRAALQRLERAGAERLVIPCNTAHHWYGALAATASVPMLNIVAETVAEICLAVPKGERIGLLATPGTIASGLYQAPLRQNGYHPWLFDGETTETLVEGGIRLVKAGRVDAGRQALDQALQLLAAQDCRYAILGCTEVSVAFGTESQHQGIRLFDSNMALARALLRHIGRVPKI